MTVDMEAAVVNNDAKTLDQNIMSLNLNGAGSDADAFEGTEKLLEIWFYPTKNSIPNNKSLLSAGLETWVELLKLVKCEVLSMKRTDKMVALLLSESSMFIYDHRITLKTCGTTTTLFCLPKLFEIVSNEFQWNFKQITSDGKEIYNPYKVFYSRRSFLFPDRQISIHKKWSAEIAYLNQFFLNGRSYLVGQNDSLQNHWNLYITETNHSLGLKNIASVEHEDETIEILMTGLGVEQANKFHRKEYPDDQNLDGHIFGAKMTKATRIDKIYENREAILENSENVMIEDAFTFEPCGYSSNIVIDNEFYYTLHVTPENGWSYASFESNVPYDNNDEVATNVLQVFDPHEFCITFFYKTNEREISFFDLKKFNGYKRKDKIIYDFDDYQLIYLCYTKTN
ncbi:hypothetical protein Kpol_543p74 [Vanderwaltozyma polyspora DSM 70294]|uniref:S-adenosylmethionine decarboxylase proenzyme n=1 Tax=Vanderwaltozyma polyspora (strain ATCC 22028 / DSM 70294 / BCRC 21397 / CBS 2163 / NBRC 10782 / NRRL Y-8283 / UCD 57-17) TaxID=436907 RepID=A7THS8_VANPO|nr:uncharacterized protein Kpol_543p74 [Vanderwaltozyma polyspora DSM 70294]EDO18244.1 hypothetical protein Kpol_543p74 [Vanderwaltozyma polyspora DSM 70294]